MNDNSRTEALRKQYNISIDLRKKTTDYKKKIKKIGLCQTLRYVYYYRSNILIGNRSPKVWLG